MVWVKRLAWVVASLFAILAIVLAYVMLFVNPNDFKDELKSVAKDKANLTLRLDGDISWSFFPWLGLGLEDIGVSIGSDPEILQFDRAEFGLAILPLLEQKIQVNKVNLVNLKASLNKNAQGQGNWQLALPNEPASVKNAVPSTVNSKDVNSIAQEDDSPLKLPNVQLDELRIENAQVQYRDEQTKQLINATLNVTVQDVQWDKAWPMVMDIALTQSDLQGQSAIHTKANLQANLTAFPEREFLSLDSVVLSGEVAGEMFPTSPIDAKLSATKIELDLPQENVLAEGVALNVLGVNLDAKVQAYQVLSDPQYSAVLTVGEFNPRYLMNRLTLPLPDMSDEAALTKARANITLEGDMNAITAQPISIVLDDTSIEANAVVELSPLRWDVSVAGKNLDLDRYLPEVVESKADTKVAVTDTNAATKTQSDNLIPIDLIRSLNGHVDMVFENLIAKKLKVDKITLDSSQSNGVVTVSPLRADLYKGSVSSKLTLDARGVTPTFKVSPVVKEVQIQPLLNDFMEMDKIAGETYINGELSAKGNSIDTLKSSLQGDLLIEIKKGALIGTNLTKTVCEGIASVRKKTLNESSFGPDTPFETMRFPAHVVNGKVSTPGLKISSAGIQVTGDGVVSLPNSSLDYQANVSLSGSQLDKACHVDEDVSQLAFPIVCKGNFDDDPAGLCRPDIKGFGKLFANIAKEELNQKLEAEKARLKAKEEAEKVRLKAKLEEKRKEEEEKLKDKLKEKLKGLF